MLTTVKISVLTTALHIKLIKKSSKCNEVMIFWKTWIKTAKTAKRWHFEILQWNEESVPSPIKKVAI